MIRFSKKTDIRQQRLPLSLVPQAPKKWRSYLKKQKQKRWLKNLLIAFAVIFTAGIIISVFRLGWWLGQPLSQAQFTSLLSPRWVGKDQINLLILVNLETTVPGVQSSGFRVQGEGQQFLLASLHPGEGVLKVLIFPVDLKISDTKGFYTLDELLTLGSVQNPPQGMDFLIASLERYLAVPIDGYVATGVANSKLKSKNSKLEELIADYHRQLQSPLVIAKIPSIVRFIKQNLKTNLAPGQVFRVLWEARGVRFDRLQVFTMQEFASINEQDSFVKQIFSDEQILKERLRVSIKNASSTPGLAAYRTRFVENLGGEVIEVENSKLKTQNSKLTVYSAPKNSQTVKRLEDILGVEAEWVELDEIQRSDVEVIVTD